MDSFDEGYYLADQHRIQQVQLSAAVMRVLAEVWKRTIDPLRLDATFPIYLAAAIIVLGRGRQSSDVLARRYYMKAATAAGFPPSAVDIAQAPSVPGVPSELARPSAPASRTPDRSAPSAPPKLTLVKALPADLVETRAIPTLLMNLDAVETSLRFTGPAVVLKQIAKGASPEVAARAGMAGTLAAGKRIMLDGGRSTLLQVPRFDKNVRGWARTSDGDPCGFCAMLISRGPVYRSEASASFSAHDRCGCSVRLVFRNDSDGGWSDQATALRKLWDDSESPTLSEWRKIYGASRPPRAVPVNKPASPSRAA
jgi:hypothetical protein